MSRTFELLSNARLSWRDGQPYSDDFNDIYFSMENGLLESEHVFMHGNQLPQRWQNLGKNNLQFIIAETGFGCGLNFLMTWYYWLRHAPATATLYYYSCEKFPLSFVDLKRCLDLWPQLEPFSSSLLAHYPVLTPGFHKVSLQQGRVQLILMLGDVCECYQQLLVTEDKVLTEQLALLRVDAWFLDGFAPSKNTAMWRADFFAIMGLLSGEKTTVSTYSAATMVKEGLSSHGFKVTRAPGFGHKKHMLIAQWHGSESSCYYGYRLTPWHLAPQRQSLIERKAIVVGAGLAGCFTAHALAKRGWQVTLIEENNGIAQGASGNDSMILYPQLSAFRSPLTEFMLRAFLDAVGVYRTFLREGVEGELKGILQFASTQKELISQEYLLTWISSYPELGYFVNADEASILAGLGLQKGGLFIPNSGWINAKSLCQFLISHPLIQLKTNIMVSELSFEQDQWRVGGVNAGIVIISSGHLSNQWQQTTWLPIRKVAGQMTFVKANTHSQSLKIPLCGKGHFLPARPDWHALGATFHIKMAQFKSNQQDDAINLAHLQELPFARHFKSDVLSSWGGVRAATPDYLPLVGPVAIAEDFFATYAAFSKDKHYSIAALAAHYPGLYVCAGFGSRGLTTIPLASDYLAALVSEEPPMLTRAQAQALSPSRFLRQCIIRSETS